MKAQIKTQTINMIMIMAKALALLSGGIVAAVLLLTLAYMLPVNPENREISDAVLQGEGWYPRTSAVDKESGYFGNYFPDVLDNSSDQIMLDTAMDFGGGGDSPLVRALESYSDSRGSYSYYWHGYVVILRPLCLILDLSGIRVLNGMAQLLLFVLLAYLIGRRRGFRHVLMLLASYVLLSPFTVSLSLQYSWVFYIAYCGAAVMVGKIDFFSRGSRYIYFFMVLGMLTSYFDLLTYPLFTWGFPLIWWLAIDRSDKKTAEWIRKVVASGISWIVGYAVLWLAKWVLASIVLNQDVFQMAVDEIIGISSGGDVESSGLLHRLNAVYLNWKHYSYPIYTLVLLAWMLWWFAGAVRNGWKRSTKACAYLLVGFSSIVWYITLVGHTEIHHFFTHRIFGVSVLAFFALSLESVQPQDGAPRTIRRNVGWALCVLLGAAAVAVPLTLSAGEPLMVSNSNGGSTREMVMRDRLSVEFRPAFPVIEASYLSASCGIEDEYVEIKLWDKEKLVYHVAHSGGFFEYKKLWWKLSTGKTYLLTIEAMNDNVPVAILVTDAGGQPLAEYGEMTVDGEVVEGQFFSGFVYSAHTVVGRWNLMFVYMSWIGILVSAAYVFSCVFLQSGKKGRRAVPGRQTKEAA